MELGDIIKVFPEQAETLLKKREIDPRLLDVLKDMRTAFTRIDGQQVNFISVCESIEDALLPFIKQIILDVNVFTIAQHAQCLDDSELDTFRIKLRLLQAVFNLTTVLCRHQQEYSDTCDRILKSVLTIVNHDSLTIYMTAHVLSEKLSSDIFKNISNVFCGLLYQLYKNRSEIRELILPSSLTEHTQAQRKALIDFWSNVFDQHLNEATDFSTLLLESVLEPEKTHSENRIQHFFSIFEFNNSQLEPRIQFVFLRILLEFYELRFDVSSETKRTAPIVSEVFMFLSEAFCNSISKLKEDSVSQDFKNLDDQVKFWIVVLLSSAMTVLVIDNKSRCQNNQNILLATCELCKIVRQLETFDPENFAPLNQMRQEGAENAEQHSAYNLKTSLIALISNLVHENSWAQDHVRECGVIDFVLNSTQIDARNPFLPQWSIVAIRHLIEGNQKNASYIDSVRKC